MTKPVITTRAGKGSALTWTEGDTNLTNLRDATVSIKAGSAGTSVVSDLNGEITLVAGTNVTLSGDNSTKEITINASGGSGISDVVQDTTPQLGGNLDVNGYALVSTSNGHIDVTPNGTGNIRLTPASGKIVLGASDWPTSMGSNGQVLTTNGAGTLTWSTSSGGITDVVQDTTPQLGGSLDVNGQAIVSVSNGNIRLEPNGTGNIQLTPATGKITLGATDWPTADGTANQVLKTNGSGTLSWTTITSFDPASPGAIGGTTPNTGEFTTLSATTTGTSGVLNVTYNPGSASGAAIQATGKDSQGGTGYFDFLKATNTTSGATNPNKSFRVNSTGQLEIINSGYSATILSLTDAGALTVPSFTSSGSIAFKDTREAIYDLGTTGGTIAPNPANGSVQKITLNSALTINAFTSPQAGQSLTLIIYGGTSYTSITSTMKFAGGIKTLTGTAGCIDILSVYYDGTNYFASLGKGYA